MDGVDRRLRSHHHRRRLRAATHDRGENHDSGFAATDPAPEPAPRLIPGHAGRGRTLGRDRTLIPEAVRVKATRRFKITDEGVAAACFERWAIQLV